MVKCSECVFWGRGHQRGEYDKAPCSRFPHALYVTFHGGPMWTAPSFGCTEGRKRKTKDEIWEQLYEYIMSLVETNWRPHVGGRAHTLPNKARHELGMLGPLGSLK